MHFTPDGRFGFIPERDQDTVSKVDLATRKIVKTVTFPAGSKPYMLRVSGDGKEVWVQSAAANTNTVLDVETMAVLQSVPMGKSPVAAAFQPGGGRYALLLHDQDTFISIVDKQTYQEVKRIEVGKPQPVANFTPDGQTAFVSVPALNEVLVLDMTELDIVERIPSGGEQPSALVLLDAASGPPGLPRTGAGGGARPRGDGWLLALGGLGLASLLGLRLRRPPESQN